MGCCNTEQKPEENAAGGCCGGAKMEEKPMGSGCCGGSGKKENSSCCPGGKMVGFFKRLFGAKKESCH